MELTKKSELDINKFNGYQMMDSIIKERGGHLIKVGKAIIEPGARIPDEGNTVHDADEYSYIIKGSLKSGTNFDTTTIESGDFSFIPAGESHWCKNIQDENCELIWFLVKKQK